MVYALTGWPSAGIACWSNMSYSLYKT